MTLIEQIAYVYCHPADVEIVRQYMQSQEDTYELRIDPAIKRGTVCMKLKYCGYERTWNLSDV